jgi:hypothetical protein
MARPKHAKPGAHVPLTADKPAVATYEPGGAGVQSAALPSCVRDPYHPAGHALAVPLLLAFGQKNPRPHTVGALTFGAST